MTAQATPAKTGQGPYKRSVKNYLIDSRFQLKYTGLIVLATAIISAALFAFLWRTSREVIDESVTAAGQSKEALDQSMKVSEMVKMSITNDPIYKDDPDLLKSVTDESNKQDQQIRDQQAALVRQQDAIATQQNTMLFGLVGALVVLVVLIGMMGIYFTHKVAGPIFKMKRLLRQVGEGKLTFEGRLRKGDELQDFFETFAQMVEALRARQAKEVDELEKAIKMAKESGANPESIARIASVHDEMKRSLEA